jgi:MarR family 2-MHQ and catechol resistance regulon transcriptional repressor
MPAPAKPSPASSSALGAYIKLMRASESVTARAHLVLPAGVTITQFAALEALLHRGPLFQSELAGKLLRSGGNLTLVVDNLERDGLVVRERDANDRRFVRVALTPKGRKFIAGLFPKVAASLTREFAVLTAAEQTTLARLCRKLGRGARPPAPSGAPAAA